MFLRNVILAICALIIVIFLTQILLSVATRHGQEHRVPDFSGVSLADAKKLAAKSSLKIEINDSLYLPQRTGGIVLEQNPAPGAKVKSGRRIFVTINSYKPKTAIIPYVTGYSLRQAKNNIEVAGFEIERLIYVEDMATNNVLEQKFDGRTVTASSNIEATVGSGIVLVVGANGGVTAKVPKVIGFPLKEAKSRLWELGLNIAGVNKDENVTELNMNEARVYRQSPNAGSSLQLGASVELFLTLDPEKVATGAKTSDRVAKEIATQAETQAEEEGTK